MKAATSTPTPEAAPNTGAAINALPQPAWNAAADGGWTDANRAWTAYTGLSTEASLGRGWLDAVHPDDRLIAETALAEAKSVGGVFAADLRIQTAQGESRLFRARAAAERDRQGGIARWIGVFTDIGDLRVARDEATRRARGIFAMVRSITRRTAASNSDKDDFVAHLEGRFGALARIYNLAAIDPSGIDLETMIRDEHLAHAAPLDKRVEIEGPKVRLEREVAEVVGLALHELATNAVKYGALATPKGRIEIGWRIEERDGRSHLAIIWSETGIPTDATLSPRGFGAEMIERMLPYELEARTSLTIAGGQLFCMIDIPATVGLVIGE